MTYLLIAWLLQPSISGPPQLLQATPQTSGGINTDHHVHGFVAAVADEPINRQFHIRSLAEDGAAWVQPSSVPVVADIALIANVGVKMAAPDRRDHVSIVHPVSIKPITLAVSPQLGVAPTVLTVQAHLTPIASDRLVQVVIESETFYRSFECQLEGEQSPKYCPDLKAFTVWIRSPGAYTIVAGIGSSAERIRAVDRTTVEIR
jgi:hypothetical protein